VRDERPMLADGAQQPLQNMGTRAVTARLQLSRNLLL
jgi:hypothetical protein